MRRLAMMVGGLSMALCSTVQAKLHSETVEYKDGAVVLQGYLAYDDSGPAKRPGIVVFHDWTGVGDQMKKRADMLAGLGYVAFAADVYGKGIRPRDPKAAAAEAAKYKNDRSLMRRRARLGLDVVTRQRLVDDSKLVAMGYCFGGTVALELARSGAPVVGTVVFHGGLDTPTPADARHIRGRVLALQGGDDPFVPPEQVLAFEKEMRDGHVDWEVVQYGGAVHSFTIPQAGNDNSKGAAYNEKADHRSWAAMKEFMVELFPSNPPAAK